MSLIGAGSLNYLSILLFGIIALLFRVQHSVYGYLLDSSNDYHSLTEVSSLIQFTTLLYKWHIDSIHLISQLVNQ